MKFAINKIIEGYDGVISPVPPLIQENFYEDLSLNSYSNQSSYYSYDTYIKLSITPRELVKFAKKNLHPMMAHNNFDNYPHSGNPAYLLWYGPDKNLLIRSLHIHPVILRVKHELPDFWRTFEGTLDEWFLPFVYSSLEKLYVVKDSDEMAIISLTPSDFPLSFMSDTFKLDSRYIASWAENHSAPMQKSLLSNYTIWHDEDLKIDEWKDAIDRSERLSREVLFFLQMPDSVLEFEYNDLFLSRNARKIRLANKSNRSANATLNNFDLNVLLDNTSSWRLSMLFLRKFLARNLNPKIKYFLKKFII
jgi:hypothetical protein